jgi:hypothetical protein
MKKLLLLLVLVMLMLVGTVVAPACTSSSTASDTTAFCNSLQNLAAAEAQVRTINASTSVDQAQQYYQDLQDAWSATVEAKQNLNVSKYSDLQNSYNELKSSLDGISGSQSVAQALPSIQAALVTFNADLNEIRTTTCSFTPTSTP